MNSLLAIIFTVDNSIKNFLLEKSNDLKEMLMPKFMKDRAIELIDGGIESYLLGLYGLTLPFVKRKRNSESKYAPVIGLFGTCAELITKAWLVQAF